MFHGQIERPFNPVHLLKYSDKRITVAINTECLHIFDTNTPRVSSTPPTSCPMVHPDCAVIVLEVMASVCAETIV